MRNVRRKKDLGLDTLRVNGLPSVWQTGCAMEGARFTEDGLTMLKIRTEMLNDEVVLVLEET